MGDPREELIEVMNSDWSNEANLDAILAYPSALLALLGMEEVGRDHVTGRLDSAPVVYVDGRWLPLWVNRGEA